MTESNIQKILIKEEASIREAMKAIDCGSIKMGVVVDNKKKILGVITDGDIRRSILKGVGIEEKASTIMNPHPTTHHLSDGEEKIRETLIQQEKSIIGIPILDEENKVVDLAVLTRTGGITYYNKSLENRAVESVLVIGGAGYIGSHLVRLLLENKYVVKVLDNFTYNQKSLENIKDNPQLEIIEGDIRHIHDITRAVQNVDAVVHLAELVGDPACALDTKRTQDINYLGTSIIAAICKHYQINRFVYMSSASVYGASAGAELLDEESSVNPVSLYAKMKLASEKALRELSDENFSPTILRLSTVFGLSDRLRFDLVVNILTAKAVREGKITVFGGDQWRPNVHAHDVANTIKAVIEAPLETVGKQVFNVGTEENNYTINKIAELVKKEVPEAELVIEDKNVDKRNYKLKFGKLQNVLGKTIKYSVSDGIKEIKKFLEEHPEIDYTKKEYSNVAYLKEEGISRGEE